MPIKSDQNSQFYIFNLFGNFIEPRYRAVWTHELLRLLQILGLEEKTIRSTLARMRQKGFLSVEKVGRQSRYALTGTGLQILQEGDARIFEQIPETWNGRWHLVTYTLPENMAQQRNLLAKKLRWAGYGNLNRGTWISPIDRSTQAQQIMAELDIAPYAIFFSGAEKVGQLKDVDLVNQCWDIDGLAEMYQPFLAECEIVDSMLSKQDNTPAHELGQKAFQHYFWLSQQFQAFPRRDPNLPAVLLPANWIGHEARKLFVDLRERLAGEIRPFLSKVQKLI